MRRPSLKGLSVLLASRANSALTAQNLHSTGKEKLISFVSLLLFNHTFSSVVTIKPRFTSYNYFISGNIKLPVFACGFRLNFSVSKHDSSFLQNSDSIPSILYRPDFFSVGYLKRRNRG
jgi:hypothetical protein